MEFLTSYTTQGSRYNDQRQDEIVSHFLSLDRKTHYLGHTSNTFPRDMMWPILLLWSELQQGIEPYNTLHLGMQQCSNNQAIAEKLRNVIDRCALRNNEPHVRQDQLNYFLDFIYLGGVARVPDITGYSEYEDMINLYGWSRAPQAVETLLNVSRSRKTFLLTKTEGNIVNLCVIATAASTEIFPRLALILSNFWLEKNPSTEMEKILMTWAKLHGGVATSEQLTELLLQYEPIKNAAEIRRQEEEQAAITRLSQAQLDTHRQALDQLSRYQTEAWNQWENYHREFKEKEQQLFVISLGADTRKEKIKEMLTYWKANPNIRDVRLFTEDDSVRLGICVPFSNYSEDSYRAVRNRRYANQETMRMFWDAVTERDPWELLLSAVIQLPFNNRRLCATEYRNKPCGINNHHLTRHNCFGDNDTAIKQAYLDDNYLFMTDAAVATVANINFRDTIVLDEFEDSIRNGGTPRAVRNKETGEFFTIAGFIRKLEEEKEIAKQRQKEADAAVNRQEEREVEDATHQLDTGTERENPF